MIHALSLCSRLETSQLRQPLCHLPRAQICGFPMSRILAMASGASSPKSFSSGSAPSLKYLCARASICCRALAALILSFVSLSETSRSRLALTLRRAVPRKLTSATWVHCDLLQTLPSRTHSRPTPASAHPRTPSQQSPDAATSP